MPEFRVYKPNKATFSNTFYSYTTIYNVFSALHQPDYSGIHHFICYARGARRSGTSSNKSELHNHHVQLYGDRQ